MSGTVLVVDDELDILLATRMLLETMEYTVIEASGGEQALELADKRSLDAIFLDLRMPGLDGWAVLETLRGNGTSSRVAVIILSAHGSPSTIERSAALGARGYVKKPFRAADLKRALDAVLA